MQCVVIGSLHIHRSDFDNLICTEMEHPPYHSSDDGSDDDDRQQHVHSSLVIHIVLYNMLSKSLR